jgi:DNA topoisomerase I
MARLRRSDCAGPGIRRVRRGRGFSYIDPDGRRLSDGPALARIRALTIPPAWTEVWICSDPAGHLQATGIDDAGRKQYRYHDDWRSRRDREKFQRMLRFARALPRLRRRIAGELEGEELTRERVLACAVRLLDVGLFRIGGEEYAEDGGGLGLATLRKEHVTLGDGTVVFDYPAKGGIRRVHEIADPLCFDVVCLLKRRRRGGPHLLAYKTTGRWANVRSDEINEHLKHAIGEEFSAKDFRTWNGTLLAAVALATRSNLAARKTARRRAINETVESVSALLGNTPRVARSSYIDPRVFDCYAAGSTIAPALARAGDIETITDRQRRRIERAVLELIDE